LNIKLIASSSSASASCAALIYPCIVVAARLTDSAIIITTPLIQSSIIAITTLIYVTRIHTPVLYYCGVVPGKDSGLESDRANCKYQNSTFIN